MVKRSLSNISSILELKSWSKHLRGWAQMSSRLLHLSCILYPSIYHPPTSVVAPSTTIIRKKQHRRAKMTTRTPRASQTSIANSLPAGVLSFTQPPQTAAASYYKIAANNPITFGWNYTYLVQTPTRLTVSAFCSSNGNTYPVGPTDGVIEGAATQVVWDAYAYEQQQGAVPLAQAEYTLFINDERGPNSGLHAGLLTPNSGMKFSLYRPRAYVPLESAYSPMISLRLTDADTAVTPRLELPRLLECNASLFSGQDDAHSSPPHLLPHVYQWLATASKTTRRPPLSTGTAHAYTAVNPLGLFRSRMFLSLFLASGRSLDTASVFLPFFNVLVDSRLLYTLLQFCIPYTP